MKKLLLVFLSMMFVLSCSIDRLDKTLVIEGIDGSTTLVGITSIEPGEDETCINGGTRLDFGVDLNINGNLDIDEITQTAYVCNGLDGKDGVDGNSSLVEVTAIQPNEEYPYGGVLVTTGYDLNGNGTLEENEISSTTVVENGADGANGLNSLVRTTTITDTEICAEGGFLIESGLDSNNDGVLQDSEVNSSNTQTLCNGEDGKSLAVSINYLQGENEYCDNGGYLLNIGIDQNGNGELEENEETVSFPICNGYDGADGVDGQDGLNGTNGTNGIDGVSTTITTEITEGGYWLIFWENNVEITRILIEDGQDGTNGINGEDGLTPVITYEVINVGETINDITYEYGGVKVIVTVGTDVTTFIVENGPQGPKGDNGAPGENGVCEDCCEDNTVTICHKVTHTNNIPEEWVGEDEVTLTLTLSEYVKHVYEYHNGNSTQNDSWGSCDYFEPVRLGIKTPYGDSTCHYNYTEVIATTQQEYDWYWNGGAPPEIYVPFPNSTFEVPDDMSADDYDCMKNNKNHGVPNKNAN